MTDHRRWYRAHVTKGCLDYLTRECGLSRTRACLVILATTAAQRLALLKQFEDAADWRMRDQP